MLRKTPFKLLKNGRNAAGNRAHSVVSSNDNVDVCSTVIHPFVDCFVDKVRVRALVDTGSMKSFLSKSIQRTIDFDDRYIKTFKKANCVSITGHSVHIQGSMSSPVKFLSSRLRYTGEFLVSDNIPYDCVLGWDFLSKHSLSLCRDVKLGSYMLVGKHGSTPLRNHDNLSTTADRAGVVRTSPPNASVDSRAGRLLCQSRFQSNTVVALVDSVMIPPRTEIILEGKLARRANSKIGLLEPRSSSSNAARQGFSVARVVVKQDNNRVVPLRVLNMSNTPIELAAGENLAEFCPLIESCLPQPTVCGAVGNQFPNIDSDRIESIIDPSLTGDDRAKLKNLLHEFSDVFDGSLGHTNILSHQINTENSTPIKQHARRIPYAHRDESARQIDEMLENGIIRESTSAWSSPIILVKKKNGELRFCVDYRKLNAVTVGHAHPLPRIDDILDSLGDSQYFSTLDLKSAYWQIPVDEKDRHKTAFVTQSGLFEFNRMPFGLSTAPTTFQRAMDLVLSGLSYIICLCYLDDVIVFGRNFSEHYDRLKTVLLRLRSHNLRVKLEKCTIAARQVAFLGHVVSQSGIKPDPAKIEAVSNIVRPSTVKDIRSFVGLAGYYRKFIPGFSTVAAPLLKLTQKAAQFLWTSECEISFQTLKQLLCSAPILAYPKFDRNFILQTDASDYGVGAVLSQLDDQGNEKVVAYASKSLSTREQQYSTTEKEAYAVVYGTEHFRVYLLGRHFEVITDHNALRWLHSMEPKGRLARWIMDLQEFNFSIKHRAGRIHTNADALSRLVHPHGDNVSCANAVQCKKFVSTIRVKLSGGRTAIVKLESSKPLLVNPNGSLVNIHDSCSIDSSFELPCPPTNVNAITLDPTINLGDIQRNDSHLSRIIDMKTRGLPKPKPITINDPVFKKWLKHYDQYFLRNSLLYRALGNNSDSFPRHVLLVPSALQDTILQALHDGPFSGHLGITRTEDRVRQRFYWPGIRTTVCHHIKLCEACNRKNSPVNRNKAPLGHIAVSQPFTFWAMDYMGPLPETSRGNKHILVVVDHFTKWCEAFATSDQKASTVAPLLISRIFSRFGPPRVLHSDQGRNFESTLLHEICNVMGITKTRTTSYHPQCDGQTERQNRTLQAMLTAFASSRRDDWDLWLDSVTFAYNTSRHDALGISPYEVVFGQAPRLPIELELGMPLTNPSTHSEHLVSIRSVFRDIRNIAQQHLSKASEKQARLNEPTNAWRPFETGQTVMLKRPKGWKLGNKWIGPYKILKRFGVNYRIISKGGEGKVVHHDQLKLSYVPFQQGEPVCPAREVGEFQVVDVAPRQAENPRARPARLRQNIRPPNRYGYG